MITAEDVLRYEQRADAYRVPFEDASYLDVPAGTGTMLVGFHDGKYAAVLAGSGDDLDMYADEIVRVLTRTPMGTCS